MKVTKTRSERIEIEVEDVVEMEDPKQAAEGKN